MDYTLRFWVEHMAPAEVVSRALTLLRRYRAGVNVAVYRNTLTDESAEAFRELKGSGLEVAYWLLLDREEGYFPNERNVGPYAVFAEQVVEWASANGVLPDLVAVDLELPFGQMTALTDGAPAGKASRVLAMLRENRDPARYALAREALADLNDRLHGRGIRTIAALLPWVALELEGPSELVQDLMETPVAGIDFDILSPMWYASMFEGMSGGLISQRDANWLMYDSCLWLRTRYGPAAGVSLGVTGTGVMGNEQAFAGPEELLAGVEAALAAGVRDISVYNLEGVLADDEPGRWMDALKCAGPRAPERSKRAARSLAFLRNAFPLIRRLKRS